MKRTTKTALIALLAGSAVLATSLSASAFGGGDRGMRGHGGPMGGAGVMQLEFADVDIDGNGQITVEDLIAHGQARFDAADTNSDGALDADEMAAQAKARMEDRQGRAEARGDGKGDRKGDRQGAKAEKRMGWMIENIIERRDADKSGTLSFDEISPDTTKLDRMIDRFDTDDDNAISADEFDAAQKEMFERHAGKDGRKDGRKGDRNN
ncbi:EF-hand domain-containing protein [Aliiroseovarius subalbicans]|uniref:EF-hand domain-containing protein n=1 Tax=Aliiroseovarius subalbicans TaxID=2925840 RepID=UPI001F56CDC9|nr:EF-hand domain-containing protein [Aliiroseovarius subalbicans]MCI2398608.1 EF-hand domain-containing protein [Aliiroseovarius subalbicans]